jgi:hypothetical protein
MGRSSPVVPGNDGMREWRSCDAMPQTVQPVVGYFIGLNFGAVSDADKFFRKKKLKQLISIQAFFHSST